MITKSQAVDLGLNHIGRRVYSPYYKNKNGTYTDIKINGKCKIWKSKPLEFRLPIKIGFRDHGYITEDNSHFWFLSVEEI